MRIVEPGRDQGEVEPFDDADVGFEQSAVDRRAVVTAADGEVVDAHGRHAPRGQGPGPGEREVGVVGNEAIVAPAARGVVGAEQQPLTRDGSDRLDGLGGDRAGIGQRDHPCRAEQAPERQLVDPGCSGDEVHRRVDVRSGVDPEVEVRDRRGVPVLERLHAGHPHRRITRPVHHAVADRHRRVEPAVIERGPACAHETRSRAPSKRTTSLIPSFFDNSPGAASSG